MSNRQRNLFGKRTVSEMFPSKWLSAADVPDGCKATVIEVTEELVGREKEEKFVVHFAEFKKPLVLNKTNAESLRDISGSEYIDEWEGVEVRLTTPTVEFGGKSVPAIRIGFPLQKRQERPPKSVEVEGSSEQNPF